MSFPAYCDKQVLVVGDGDLSFAASLALHIDDPQNLTASVWEDEAMFKTRYGETEVYSGLTNMETLKMYKANLEFGVDATKIDIKETVKLDECSMASTNGDGPPAASETIRTKKWDAIIFNFPYPVDWNKHNVLQKSQELAQAFLSSALRVLAENGTYTFHIVEVLSSMSI